MSKLAVEPEEVLAVVENRDRDKYPVMSTRDVAKGFDVSNRTISNRLSDLADEGRLQRLDTGVAPMYLLPDEKIAERDPDAAEADDDSDDPDDEIPEPTDLATEGGLAAENHPDEDVELREAVRELRQDVVAVHRSQEKVERRVAGLSGTEAGADASEDTAGSWADRAAREAEIALGTGIALFALSGILFGLLAVTSAFAPPLLSTPIPLVGADVAEVLALGLALSLLVGAVALPLSGALSLLNRSGLIQAAEARYSKRSDSDVAPTE